MIITLQTLIFFRESLLNALDRILRPYYTKLSLSFGRHGDVSDDDDSEDQVFADFDDEKGVVFFPPVYLQRYAAVSDCLLDERWCGKLQKVVDLGYHDMSFIKYLKELSGIISILGVDLETIPLRCSSDLMDCGEYGPKRENPLQVTLFQGNAADPDYRLIGCDAVIAIEMIEHMLPHDLDRLIHTVFGFIKPWVAIFTTPNGDFNVLFKSMEKNGLRRLDHFFEWSREQFYDWCSNIVARYPEYTVSCKGIGPGPPGTLHLGCCSQMAVFMSKDYHKQQDLNLDSLALVANAPNPNNMSELMGDWDSSEALIENNMICPPNNEESYTELFSEKQSCVTILIASPDFSVTALTYHDKTSQCNLDIEAGRSYMMFDYEQMCFDLVVPRRTVANRVYMIEDVNSRLNCSTQQVTKFSKATQNLISKNKVDLLVHTREVVDEIRQLTKMLNFNKEIKSLENGVHIWNNINWGDNAPYWNQYYRVVREYNPPYEIKSEECRIVDLITDEINRLIDYQDGEGSDLTRLEIPIDHLMAVVAHITDDMDKVRDLLEWNGYEIVDNVVIHSRLLDNASASLGTQEDEWHEDSYSDWDSTDIRSTTLSDGSTIVPDYYARCLHRALDQKVRKLRTMLTADEDITTELDRVVCRLMKLALRTSRGRHSPPPSKWMQCKLLDLLTLTEKAIERRKRLFIENYPLKSIRYDDPMEKSQEMIALEKIKEDNTALKIVNKYSHLVTDSSMVEESRANYRFIDLELEDDLSVTSADFLKGHEYIDRHSPSLYELEPNITDMELYNPANEKTKLERTQAWLEDDLEVVSYPEHDTNIDNSSGDTDHSTSLTKYYKKKFKKYKSKKQSIELKCVVCKRSHSKYLEKSKERKQKDKTSTTRSFKKVSPKKSSYNNLFKDSNNYMSVDYRYKLKPRKEYKSLQPTASKPIPASLIELCHPELMIEDNIEINEDLITNFAIDDRTTKCKAFGGVAATEQSFFIDIVMDDVQETISLKRTIGLDAEVDMNYENETLIRSVSNTVVNNVNIFHKRDVAIDKDDTIFLNDINEPSTSKGIRHVGMDVQCGPDISVPDYSILSATTSITRMPSIFTAGIKIGDSCTDTTIKSIDCCTSTDITDDACKKRVPKDTTNNVFTAAIKIGDSCNYTKMKSIDCCTFTDVTDNGCKTVVVPKDRSVGIIIKEDEPDQKVTDEIEISSMTHEQELDRVAASSPVCSIETKLLKSIPSRMKVEYSGSEFTESVGTISPNFTHSLNSDLQIVSSVMKDVGVSRKQSRYVRPKLSCGGVQVHSYKDKQTSEDIMYQGEWQNSRPKVLVKKKVLNSVNVKRITDSTLKRKISSKEKILAKHDVKINMKKDSQNYLRPSRVDSVENKGNENGGNCEEKRSLIPKYLAKVNKPVRNNTRVTSKVNCKLSSKLKLSSVSTTKPEPATVVRKRSVVVNPTKNVPKIGNIVSKDNLPYYLRKKCISPKTNNKENLNRSLGSAKPIINMKVNGSKTMTRSKTEEIKRDLLKFQNKPPEAKYVILHNEIEQNNSTKNGQQAKNTSNNNERRSAPSNRSVSPQSRNSSTCSSPNSVATVKAASVLPKNANSRRHSASSYKNTSSSENNTPNKNKRTKRSKSSKIYLDKNNKENIPQSSKQSITVAKISDKTVKGTFSAQKKDVYIAQLQENVPIQSSTNKKPKSNMTPPKSDSATKRSISPTFSRKSSHKSDDCLVRKEKDSSVSAGTEISNIVIVLESHTQKEKKEITNSPKSDVKMNRRLITEWIDSNPNMEVKQPSNIIDDMRVLLEEILDFIDGSFDNNCSIDSETVILSRDESNNAPALFNGDLNASPTSFKTIITNENNSLKSDLEQALNLSFNKTLGDESTLSLDDTGLTVTDLDMLSFKSITSMSKYSEYFSADNDISGSRGTLPTQQLRPSSLKDIYERKDQLLDPVLLNNAGAIANQAFSGFSISDDPIAGDKQDPINFVDSETGSMAVDVSRQANSEELFVSGRSSSSFGSCLIDEEAVVPSWLFQIISLQQASEDEVDPPQALMLPLAVPDEPMYDANGNVADQGIGFGAGAGDGRGIHSDQSQDSSGRGTSLSSSPTSSGAQSDTIFIEPSEFVAQYEGVAVLEHSTDSSIVMVGNNDEDNELRHQGAPSGANSQSFSHGESRGNPRIQVNTASDVDADISSLETDAQDSSEN